MELSDGLGDTLKNYFSWGKPRLECFAGMLLALLQLKRIKDIYRRLHPVKA